MKRPLLSLLLILCLSHLSDAYGQEKSLQNSFYIRTGVEANWLDDRFSQNPLNTGFMDIGFLASPVSPTGIKGKIDILFRSGVEFGQTESYLKINEAWGGYRSGKFDVSAGKKIIKWSSNLSGSMVNIFNPKDYTFRSPERNEYDLGILFASLGYQPSSTLLLELLVSPLYTPSVLPLEIMALPDYVLINELKDYNWGNGVFSSGLRLKVTLPGIDMASVIYHGPDPMPLLKVTSAVADTSGGLFHPSVNINITPVKSTVVSIHGEMVAGRSLLRFESHLKYPEKSRNEFRSFFPEFGLNSGIEFGFNLFTIQLEYFYRQILRYSDPPEVPQIPSEIPPIPPEYLPLVISSFQTYIERHTASFNRLIVYQMEPVYHSLTAIAGWEDPRQYLSVLLALNYNITADELMVAPSLKYNPSDGVSLHLGLNYYGGSEGSIYDLTGDYMSSVYCGLKVRF